MPSSARFWPEPFVAGVSLTYDGSRPEHLDFAIPALDSEELKGTFFAYPPEFILRLAEWKAAASRGHEIGNGFMMGAVDKGGAVPAWSAEAYDAELAESEELIGPLNSLSTFGYPCVRTECSDAGMPVVSKLVRDTTLKLNVETLAPIVGHYDAVRTSEDGFNDTSKVSLNTVKCYIADGMDPDSLALLTHIGISQGAWTVLVFSAMRDTKFDAGSHQTFLAWLAQRKELVQIAPFGKIAMLTRERANVKV